MAHSVCYSVLMFLILIPLSGASASDSCDSDSCTSLLDSTPKRPFNAMISCIRDVLPTCSGNGSQAFIDYFGAPLDDTFIKTCIDPLDVTFDACNVQQILTPTFSATDKECRDVEGVWNCTRPHFDGVKTTCHADGFIEMTVDKANKGMAGKLDDCVKHGFNVTVDYSLPDAASIAAWSPLMTLAISLATAGLLAFQVR